ncbi:MAG TPA: colanic acid biosynthesis glycosyltransferase WcaL, partial [Candidatus Methylomirabilis sp.]|nr:colanic acid biosynthesis glycosyltransferase WcaL [Candidatus Methylomirabilis sp.]
MSLAYLLNWYPQPSLTPLRCEMTALEEVGIPFHRFSLRRYEGELVDEKDRAERERTRSVLDAGVFGFLGALFRVALQRPRAFARALRLAV